MRTILLRASVLLAALALVAALGGCLISGTKVFSFSLGDINVTGNQFERDTIDLTNDDTYKEHKDEIRLIDRVGFTCKVVNNSANAAAVSMYFSTNAGLLDPETQATPLFRNFQVAGSGTEDVTYDESLALIENFDALQAAVETGNITFYTNSPGGLNMLIDDMVLIVTFTVGI